MRTIAGILMGAALACAHPSQAQVAPTPAATAPAPAPPTETAAPAKPVLEPRPAAGDVVTDGIALPPATVDGPGTQADGVLTLPAGATLRTGRAAGAGDFRIKAFMAVREKKVGNAGIVIGTSLISLDCAEGRIGHKGPLFFGSLDSVEGTEKAIRAGAPFELEVVRTGKELRALVNGEVLLRSEVGTAPLGRILFRGGAGALQLGSLTLEGDVFLQPRAMPLWVAAGAEWDEHYDPAMLAEPGTVHAWCTGVTSAEDGSDRTAILHRASRDGGTTWSPSVRVTPAGEPLASRPVPFRANDGTVRVLYQTIGPMSPRTAASMLRVAALAADGTWATAPATVEGLPADLRAVRLSTASACTRDGRIVAAACTLEADGSPRLHWLTSEDGTAWRAGPATDKASADLSFSGDTAIMRSAASPSGTLTVAAGAEWATATPATGLIPSSQRPALLALPGKGWLAFVAEPRPPHALAMFGTTAPKDPWVRLWNPHDAAAGAACAVLIDGAPALLVEAGEGGRRESVAFIRVDARQP